MSSLEHTSLEVALQDLILRRALVRDIRPEELHADPIGSSHSASQHATAILNKVERELGAVIENLSILCGVPGATAETHAACMIVRSGRPPL